MRAVIVGLVGLVVVLAVVYAADSPVARPAPLEAAQQMLAQNLALGDPAAGKPVPRETAVKAEKLMADGITVARAAVTAQPKNPQAHYVLGALLSLAYRAAEGDGKATPLVRGAKSQAEMMEGLAELRKASQLQPKNAAYQLDCVKGLLAAGQTKLAVAELDSLPKRFPNLSPSERATLAQLRSQPAGSATAASSGRITWLSYQEGMATAQREGKRTLVDFMADWCGYCRKMDADTFSNASVIALSSRYVFARVNVDQQGDLARQFRVSGLPTLVVLDPGGREITRFAGYLPPQEFLRQVQ